MASKTKQKYYVVWKGHQTGVYASWDECQKQINGFKNALYRAFPSEAEARYALHRAPVFEKKTPATSMVNNEMAIKQSIAVDAACSGNPGKMEYRGVYVQDGKELFHFVYPLGTNNIGEFLALVHGLSYLKKHQLPLPLYSDSVNAMKWVEAKKCKTKLERNAETEELFQYIARAEHWLNQNTWTTKILKWHTETWGEIPADFGRK